MPAQERGPELPVANDSGDDGPPPDKPMPQNDPGFQAPVTHCPVFCSYCAQLAKELECENVQLKQQVKKQFQDLDQLDEVMDQLEIRVNDHEVVIKRQNQRIQDQEETIQVLGLLIQQYLLALVLKNKF